MVLLLDAANTIIHKPSFSEKFIGVLESHSIPVDRKTFAYHHKLLSEAIVFPDKTSKDFYMDFNRQLLFTLGILPQDELLNEVFLKCSYLPWVPFEDVKVLADWKEEISVLSNFHAGLVEILDACVPNIFSTLVISEKSSFRKPDIRFYQEAIDKLQVEPKDILYIGDSPKLDLNPALQTGMNAWLIDRDNFYPNCSRRISSLAEIFKLASR